MAEESILVRTEMRPGDLGAIVSLHGVLYEKENGFDCAFEAYVAEPLAEFVKSPSSRQRIWLAETGGEVVGCVAIVEIGADTAQLRWFLLDPRVRGRGLGRQLLEEALGFCRVVGYQRVILWTVQAQAKARKLYEAAGFRKTLQKPPAQMWGAEVVEEKYELELDWVKTTRACQVFGG